MTKEEAKQFLDNMKHEEAGRGIGAEGFYAELIGYHIQALNMAIKALEHEQALGEAFNIAFLYGKEKGMEAIDKALYQMGMDGLKEQEIKALEQESYKVSEYDKDHIWYKGWQYISLRRFLEVKKTLEQEPMTDVLDKIRAEIEEQVLESLSDGGDDWFAAEKVNECLDIIDKYKAESEEQTE